MALYNLDEGGRGGADTGYVNFFSTPKPTTDPYTPPGTEPGGYVGGSITYPTPSGGYDYGQNLPKVQGPDVPSGRMSPFPPVVTGPMPRPQAPGTGSVFGPTSSYTDLVNYLNSNRLDANSAGPIVQQYAQAQGLTGNQGNPNGLNWGQYDPTRNKYYAPGADIRLENGQWVAHPWGAGSDSGGGNVFSDPATAEWESLLRQISGQLQTPYMPPDFNSLTSYLQKYAQQLQGPAYTPQQQDIIKTSTTEPIMQARDAALQRLNDSLSARGIAPTSGIAEDERQQIQRYYQTQSDQANQNFAVNAIGLDRQNAAQAGNVLGTLNSAETGLQQGNEQRLLQSLGLMGQIPQLADQRLQLALQTMAPNNINPLSALQTLLGQNNINTQQSNAYWLALGQGLASLFGGGGVI